MCFFYVLTKASNVYFLHFYQYLSIWDLNGKHGTIPTATLRCWEPGWVSAYNHSITKVVGLLGFSLGYGLHLYEHYIYIMEDH